MIISHRHKFIFIKTNKTAGTSVEIALSKFCGQDDIITPISPEDEALRRRLGYRGAQNFRLPLSTYSASDWRNLLLKGRAKKFFDHMSASAAKPLLGNDVWDRYYKFCIERNPWDRAISFYFWRTKRKRNVSLTEFIHSDRINRLKARGWFLYTLGGKLAVDRVCGYEHLDQDLEELQLRHLGLPEPLMLPRAKGSVRQDRRPYREVLSDQDRRRIASLFAEEIELFGYEY